MIRNRHRPAKVCTGDKHLRKSKPKEIIEEAKAELFKPDVRVMDESTPKDPNKLNSKIFNIIPLRKNIHIVSSSQLANRRKLIEEQKYKTLVDWDSLNSGAESSASTSEKIDNNYQVKKKIATSQANKVSNFYESLKEEQERNEEETISPSVRTNISIRLKLNSMDYTSAYESIISEQENVELFNTINDYDHEKSFEVQSGELFNGSNSDLDSNDEKQQSSDDDSLDWSHESNHASRIDFHIIDPDELHKIEYEETNHLEGIHELSRYSDTDLGEQDNTINNAPEILDSPPETQNHVDSPEEPQQRKKLTKRIRLDTMSVIHEEDSNSSNELIIMDNDIKIIDSDDEE